MTPPALRVLNDCTGVYGLLLRVMFSAIFGNRSAIWFPAKPDATGTSLLTGFPANSLGEGGARTHSLSALSTLNQTP